MKGDRSIDRFGVRRWSSLVGREEEMTTLAKAIDEAIRGNGNTVMIEGEAGIGKSRLISEIRAAAEEKGVAGDVSGDADILLFHEINGANAAYKLFTAFLPDYLNASIVTGAKIPLVLPSRADPVSTKLLSIALAAVLMSSPVNES